MSQINPEPVGTEANTAYQKTILDKEELLRVLGDEGELVIKKVDGTEIKKINKQNIKEDEKIITINYEELQKEIVIEINQAKKTGTINIMHEKVILPEYKQRNEVKQLEKLVTIGTLKQTNQIEEKEKQAITTLQETVTKAETTINNNKLVAGKTNQNVEIKTTLVTNKNKYDLYKNPCLEVEFPEKVQKVDIKNVSLLYGEGLIKENEEIYQNAEGKIVAKISLVGEQANYSNTDLVEGANIILNCDVTVDQLEQNEKDEIQIKYTSQQDGIQYENDGICKAEVNYIVTEESKIQMKNEQIMKANEAEQSGAPITVTKTISAGNDKDIYEGQVQKYTIKIKNNTNQEIRGITVTDQIPEELTYVAAIIDKGFYNEYKEDMAITKYAPEKIETLGAQEEINLFYYVRVKQEKSNTEKTVGTKATVIIEGDETVYESNLIKNTIKESKFQIDMITRVSADESYQKGSGIDYKIVVKNIANETSKNTLVSTILPKGVSYLKGCDMLYEEEYEHYYPNDTESKKEAQYDKTTDTVTWEIGDLKPGEEKAVYLMIELQEVNTEAIKVATQAMVKAEGTGSYKSNIEEINQAPTATCTITKETNLTDKYVYEETEFEYILTVKNTGKQQLMATLIDEIPEGLYVKEINYTQGEETYKLKSSEVSIPCRLEAGKTMVARILVQSNELPSGTTELEVKNKAILEESTLGTIESNEVTTIIKKDPNNKDEEQEGNEEENKDNNRNQYMISGTAWIDENQNGIKDSIEEMLAGVPITLYGEDGKIAKDSDGNEITATTSNDGSYTLSNINKGNYVVVFQYDNTNYTLTEYEKSGVEEERNSNVTATKVNGKMVAVTDTIEITNKDIENINMGVIRSQKFDLRLNKYITNISVQNGTNTKQYSYNNADFAKIEIDRKTVNDTNITIEYKISVTNEGEIPGYAEQIIDYLPEDLQVDPSLNEDWEEEDGKLVSTSLAEEILNPGETKELSLIVNKQLTEDNLGTITNTAEIAEDYNENSVGDIDSMPANKKTGEDDMSTASVIIGLNTGRVIMYISLILMTAVILGTGIYIIKKKL